jgi:hypothetical protein
MHVPDQIMLEPPGRHDVVLVRPSATREFENKNIKSNNHAQTPNLDMTGLGRDSEGRVLLDWVVDGENRRS